MKTGEQIMIIGLKDLRHMGQYAITILFFGSQASVFKTK